MGAQALQVRSKWGTSGPRQIRQKW